MKSHVLRLKSKTIYYRNFKGFDEQKFIVMSKTEIFLLRQRS